MPELAEVEYYRRRWDPGMGQRVEAVLLHPRARVFRGLDPRVLRASLTGAVLLGSEARGKQLLFRFGLPKGGPTFLGIHLGMTGRLRVVDASGPASHLPRSQLETMRGNGSEPRFDPRHDHLCLRQRGRVLVFSDARLFGRVRLAAGPEEPEWWSSLPPDLLANRSTGRIPAFTPETVAAFLRRRARTPVKAVLLMQERFPGIGNWMADEILWRASIHPATPAGLLTRADARRIWKETRFVTRGALRTIGRDWRELPRGWLFHVRWSDGQLCPRTRVPLVRERIGGRTTCWSPGRQIPRR